MLNDSMKRPKHVLEEAIVLAPTFEVYHTLGLVYEEFGDKVRAMEFCRLAAHSSAKYYSYLWKRLVALYMVVESVGEGVTNLQLGDHVLPVFTGECKECLHCKLEESRMCDLLRINTIRGVMLSDGKSRFTYQGQPIYHFVGTSTFNKYTVTYVSCLAKINPAAPLDKACVLSCGISTAEDVGSKLVYFNQTSLRFMTSFRLLKKQRRLCRNFVRIYDFNPTLLRF